MDIIRKIIRESIEEAIFDEERISNSDALEKVKNRENFVGSHVFGEDLGDYGEMYVVYSYGEQFPLYVWYKDTWYQNENDYYVDGEPNIWTRKHKEMLRPTQAIVGRPISTLKKVINKFKKKKKIKKISHKSLEPGEK